MGFMNASPDDDYRINAMPGTTDVPPPSAFEGVLAAIPKGIAEGGIKVADMASDLGTTDIGSQIYGGLLMQPATAVQGATQMARKAAQNSAAMDVLSQWGASGQDPRVTGAVGRIAAGTTEGLTIGLAGGAVAGPWGAAALLGTTEGHSTYTGAIAQGEDPTTALEQAGITGVASAAGAFLPMKFGSTLGSSILGGAGANVALGAAQRASTAAVLDANGYPQQAAQYKVFDGEAMASDAILGGAFGAFGHFMHGVDPAKINPADVDAAAAVATEEHFNRSAPGVPVDPVTANLHVQTMEDALKTMADGGLPEVSDAAAQHLVDNVVADPLHETDSLITDAASAELPGYDEAAAHIEQMPLPPEQLAPPRSSNGLSDAGDMLGQGLGLGILRDFADAVIHPPTGPTERVATVERDAPARNPNSSDVLLDDGLQWQLDHFVHNYGDAPYHDYGSGIPEYDNYGKPTTMRQAAAMMQAQRNGAESFAKLHDIAGACAAANA